MRVIVNGTLELEQGQVILERGRIVFTVHQNAFHVLRYRALGLQLAGDVKLTEHGDERGEESVCGKELYVD